MRKNSATFYILSALVPYTKANLKLSYKPSSFFYELDKIQNMNHNSLKTSFKRAVEQKYIELNNQNIPHITDKGLEALGPYISKKLKDAQLMVIFDIPEDARWKRQKFRSILRDYKFVQVQKSVWMTSLDCQKYILSAVKKLDLKPHVKLFEAKSI